MAAPAQNSKPLATVKELPIFIEKPRGGVNKTHNTTQDTKVREVVWRIIEQLQTHDHLLASNEQFITRIEKTVTTALEDLAKTQRETVETEVVELVCQRILTDKVFVSRLATLVKAKL